MINLQNKTEQTQVAAPATTQTPQEMCIRDRLIGALAK